MAVGDLQGVDEGDDERRDERSMWKARMASLGPSRGCLRGQSFREGLPLDGILLLPCPCAW